MPPSVPSLVEPSGPNRPFSRVMAEADDVKRKLRAASGPKVKAQRVDRRPPWPEGWRAITKRQCQNNASLWPKPGQLVMVPFPGEWREGTIEEEPRVGRGNYLVTLKRTGGKLSVTLADLLVKQ